MKKKEWDAINNSEFIDNNGHLHRYCPVKKKWEHIGKVKKDRFTVINAPSRYGKSLRKDI